MFRRFFRHPVARVGGGAVLLVFLYALGWLRPFEFAIFAVFNPVQASLYRVGVRMRQSPLFTWRSVAETEKALQVLRADTERATREIVKLRLAGDENKTLRQLLKFREEHIPELMSARIIVRKTEPGTYVLFIDRGRNDGVQNGMPVVAGSGVLIGKISRVHEAIAEVVAVPDPRFRAAVSLADALDTEGYVRGEGGVSMLMELIPAAITVLPNTLVVTSGLEAGIPRGLIIGSIAQSLPDGDRLFQRAALTPLFSYHRVTDVGIIFPPRE